MRPKGLPSPRKSRSLVTDRTRAQVTRRTFLIFALGALAPTLAGAAIAYFAVRTEVSTQVSARLLDAAKNYGLTGYSCLTTVGESLQKFLESTTKNSALPSHTVARLTSDEFVSVAQGYYFSNVLPPLEFLRFCRSRERAASEEAHVLRA